MIQSWTSCLKYDPLSPLMDFDDPVLEYHVRQDLLGRSPGPEKMIWGGSYLEGILKKQNPDGSLKC